MRIPEVIRRPLVSVRDGIDARLHQRRLVESVARLRRLKPESLLFLCLGNICRSPYADRVIRKSLPDDYIIESAGFLMEGRTPPVEALDAAAARGVQHGDHRSRLVRQSELTTADAVFIFDRFNASDIRQRGGTRPGRLFWLGDFDPEWTGTRAIIDPWGRGPLDFAVKFERIDRCLDTVVTALTSEEEVI